MDWRIIPSLASLRAFEATARNRSFSAAARELNVTHAAIAQHVRSLEAHFGEALVFRQGQSMALTDAGARLAMALEDGFSTIEAAVREMLDQRATRPLNISLTPSFAEAWLMPRLGDFWNHHPEIEVAMNPSMNMVDLRRDGFDMAIRFGDGNWPALRVEPLALSAFVVVGAPKLVQGRALDQIGDLTQYTWFMSHASAEQIIWGEAIGLDFDTLRTREMANNGLALAAVEAGYGLSIQSLALVERDIADGRLAVLYEGDPGTLGYYMVTREGVLPPSLTVFMKWLRKTAKAEAAG